MSLRRLVVDVMSREVVTLLPEDSLAYAAEMIRLHGFRHLPVVDAARKVVGVLSQRDLMSAAVSAYRPNSADSADGWRYPDDVQVARVMSPNPVTVRPQCALRDAVMALAGERRPGCLPVVDDSGRPIGILTTHDVLLLAAELLDDSPYCNGGRSRMVDGRS